MELELKLKRSELSVLVLHMNIMRVSIKKGFKANYGLLEGRKKIKLYDAIKEKFSSGYDEEMDHFIFDLAADEVDMLASFLNWYVGELKKSSESEGNEVYEALNVVKGKICYLDELVTDEILRNAT